MLVVLGALLARVRYARVFVLLPYRSKRSRNAGITQRAVHFVTARRYHRRTLLPRQEDSARALSTHQSNSMRQRKSTPKLPTLLEETVLMRS